MIRVMIFDLVCSTSKGGHGLRFAIPSFLFFIDARNASSAAFFSSAVAFGFEGRRGGGGGGGGMDAVANFFDCGAMT